jgi:coatomer protein complex subunit gamma
VSSSGGELFNDYKSFADIRCLDDVDDEVRDRAAMYVRVLDDKELADVYVREEATFSLAALESELASYVKDDSRHSTAFDLASVPKVSREQAAAEVASSRPSALESINASSSKTAEPVTPATASETQSSYAAQIAAVPEFESYGQILKSSPKPIALTESETEYVVSAVKHVFKEHVVFQFNISNTIPDTVLEELSVIMGPQPDCGLVEDFIIPVTSLTAAEGTGAVYVSYTREEPSAYASGSFSCTLRFVSKEVDPSTGEPEDEGYPDEYQIEDVDLGAADVSPCSFR